MDMQNKAKNLIEMIQTAPAEWKLLTEVADLTRGRVISKGYLADNLGNYPVYSSQTLNNGEIGKINSFDFDGEFVSWTTDGANAGTVFYRSGKFSITNVCGLIRIKNIFELNYKFLFYWLSIEAKKHVYSGMGNPKLMSHQMGKIQIPIPPLETQQKIVKILDKFTELEATLEAELALRKRQYQYYRDFLLDFDNQIGGGIADGYQGRLKDVVWKTLGEVGEVRMCKRILKDQTSSFGDVPFYKIGTFGKNPNSYISRKLFEEYKEKYHYPRLGEVLISASGTIGRTVIFDGQDAYFQDSNIVWIENDEKQVLNKYLFYFYQIAKWDVAEGGTIPRLYNESLRKMLVPIPSLPEQEKIAAILDKFDTLTHSISEGLPHEIALRRKQYEYYREQLLAFPKAT
ncbi:TPA: restriction endonuclease subunit S [Neisseria meningitidis]